MTTISCQFISFGISEFYHLFLLSHDRKDDLDIGLMLLSHAKKDGVSPNLVMCRCLLGKNYKLVNWSHKLCILTWCMVLQHPYQEGLAAFLLFGYVHSGGKTKQMMYVLGPSDKLTSWILILPSMGSGTYIVVYREQSFKRFWFPGTYWYICDNYGYVHLIWGKHKDKPTLLLEGPYSL